MSLSRFAPWLPGGQRLGRLVTPSVTDRDYLAAGAALMGGDLETCSPAPAGPVRSLVRSAVALLGSR
jgi:hypothetical protein